MKRRINNRRGFTMAEMLIVVAIIAILGGVGFVAVQNHQRDLAAMERDAVAKEIFIAAQNHLTMADSQGYNGTDMTGEDSVLRDDETGTVYWVSNASGAHDDILRVMLPFGAIDDTVRTGGRYIIRYQPGPARVLDVFYWTTDARYGTSSALELDAGLLALGDAARRSQRKSNRPMMGWYGGEGAITETGEYLNAPSIAVENAERLTVTVTDTNTDGVSSGSQLKLIVRGMDSDARVAFTLSFAGDVHTRVEPKAGGQYVVTLDDITRPGMHFADLSEALPVSGVFDRSGSFIPGEDIVVQAVAYSNEALTNIAYSAEITVNSLFADIEPGEAEGTQAALIGNIRHLENLDKRISGVNTGDQPAGIASARQIADLSAPEPDDSGEEGGETLPTEGEIELGDDDDDDSDDAASDLSWPGFVAATGAGNIYALSDTAEKEGDCYFLPVSPDYVLAYDGQGHSISGVAVNSDGNAGLFGAMVSGSGVANLKLIDFDITGTTNAGALAGSLTGTTVQNVVAYNTTDSRDATVTATGSAGGLIGSASGGSVEKSAAALVVVGDNAGGLIGSAAGGAAVNASYSGGHTKEGTYYDGDAPIYNVTGTTTAGGLIGAAGDAAVSGSYSTCSAIGATAGGLIGTGSGAMTNCYAAGLVGGSGETPATGAFAGTLTGTAADCRYFGIVNDGMDALSTGAGTGLSELDADTDSYDAFLGAPDTWTDAAAYDSALGAYYQNKFDLKSVVRLGATLEDGDFAATHYGDWPAPETFVINEVGT